jgi:hypothetical protein
LKIMNKSSFFFRLLCGALLGASTGAPAQTTAPFAPVTTPFPQAGAGSVAWGDYDNDGCLDLLIMGTTTPLTNAFITNCLTQLWHNDGQGNFHQVYVGGLPPLFYGTVAWVDFDNDGYLDFMIAGYLPSPAAANGYGVPTAQLWHNEQGTNFTLYSNSFPGLSFEALSAPGGSPNAWASPGVAWGDYNHDGLPDLLIAANPNGANNATTNVVEVWQNNGNGNFTLAQTLGSWAGADGISLAYADMDNDGWIDIVVEGVPVSGGSEFQIWHNNQANPLLPPFTLATNLIIDTRLTPRSFAVFDSENNGLLDMAASTDSSFDLFQNLGGCNFSPLQVLAENIQGGAVAAGDFNNDGNSDLAAIRFGGRLFENAGGDIFSWETLTNATPLSYPALAWGDYDNDGRLDLVLNGSANGTLPLQLWHNQTPVTNTPPTAPTGLAAVPGNNYVTLSWNPATDAQTPSAGLNYNIRVGTSPGTANVVGPMADLATGWRRLPQRGLIQTTNYVLTNLPPAVYYWSVQAIDTAFAGGPFASEGTFVLPEGAAAPPYAANVTSNSAVLYGTAYLGNDLATDGYFQWGLTTSYGSSTPSQNLGSGPGAVPYHQALTALQPSTYYHFRSVLTSSTATNYSLDSLFYTDPNIIVGDLNGTGIITASEISGLLGDYFDTLSPVAMTNASTAGGGLFNFAITNLPGWSFNVQVSSDLVTWSNLPTAAAPYYQFEDPQATNSTVRYYRLR